MNLGALVTFGENKKWVLIKCYKKTIKGVSETKVFQELPPRENFSCSTKPYTKERASRAEAVSLASLNRIELKDFNAYKQHHFETWLN